MKKRIKRYKKTYAIYHLTEKHTVFYLGKTRVHVSFTGGIVTKRGVTPATFTTDDPIVQLAIENSGDFRKGAIKLAGQYALGGEVVIGGNPKETAVAELEESSPCDKPADADEVPEANSACEDTVEMRSRQAATLREGDTCGAGETAEAEAAGEDADEMRSRQAATLQEVEVSCKDVAKQYLQEHFNENPTPLRTIALVQECAAKYGIVFKFV